MNRAIQISTLVVLLLIIVLFIAPMIMAVQVTRQSSAMMDSVAEQFENQDRLLDGDITAGGNAKALRAAHEALTAKTAFPGEAGRNTNKLNIALVSFDMHGATNVPPLIPVTLEISALKSAGLVLIAEGPVNWVMQGTNPFQRAKIALEGLTPVTATNVHKGLLAGTRIKTLDSLYASGVKTIQNDRRRFCDSMKDWARFYELSLGNLRVWSIKIKPSQAAISATDNGFTLAGGKKKNIGQVSNLCD